jgi:hypothetical protein
LRAISVCARPCFFDPLRCLGIPDEIEQPTEKRDAVVASKPELRGVRSESIREGAWLVVDPVDRVSHGAPRARLRRAAARSDHERELAQGPSRGASEVRRLT